MEFENRIPKLINGYLRGDLTASQQQELFDWVNESDSNSLYFNKAIDEKLLTEKFKHFDQEDVTPRIDKTLESVDPESKPTSKGLWVKMKKYTIAACLLLFVSSGIYYIIQNRVSNKKDTVKTTIANNKNDVPPGTDKAILTLADGSTIQLNNSGSKKIADQNGTAVNQQGAQLVYDATQASSINRSVLSYNTLATKRGNQYQLVLPDGSHAWLNAASSIRYPIAFTGNERKVEITGEVYFEVAKNRAIPFKVVANGMQVEVLGTHFNINSYEDEATIKTTLLEGAVKIVGGGKGSFLKPGQQAQLTKEGDFKISNDVNTEVVIAWKDQIFQFESDDLKTIMRQISRWYDVEVVYEGNALNRHFTGMISRNKNLSEVLKMLELSDVHFRVEGKKVIVTE